MPDRASRRDRVRRSTLAEIHAAARSLLVSRGSAAVTINAVAREMGMSGPALYHYYSSHDELVGAVTAGFFQELAEEMERAREERSGATFTDQLLAICRAMRSWAIGHPAEFEWIFASPVSERNREFSSERHQSGRRFEQVLLELIIEVWEARPFPAPVLEDLPTSLRDQLRDYSATIDYRLPPEASHVFLSCWTRLYGLLCMEVLHQLDFAFTDPEPVFEMCLRDLLADLDLEYPE